MHESRVPPRWPSGEGVRLEGGRPGFDSSFGFGDISGSSHTSDLHVILRVATLPGAWRDRVSVGTRWPGVSILGLGGEASWICNFYLSVAARTVV